MGDICVDTDTFKCRFIHKNDSAEKLEKKIIMRQIAKEINEKHKKDKHKKDKHKKEKLKKETLERETREKQASDKGKKESNTEFNEIKSRKRFIIPHYRTDRTDINVRKDIKTPDIILYQNKYAALSNEC
jgi:hypothetical protein